MKQGPGFNPLEEVFHKPPKGTDLRGEHGRMASGELHGEDLYGDEGLRGGGEKVDPATGEKVSNIEMSPIKSIEGISRLVVRDPVKKVGGKKRPKDIMGDLPDPSLMSLDDLKKTQEEGQ